jgi:hypothetical protein
MRDAETNLVIRYGPSPDAGATVFTGTELRPVAAAELDALVADHDALYAVAAAIWRRLVATADAGHMLLGTSRGCEYAFSPGPCGLSEPGPPVVRLKNYRALFAVARTGPRAVGDAPLDLAVDYRATEGPGDTSIRPVVFDVMNV